MKGIVSGVTTAYVGSYFEWTGSTSTMKKYYTAAGSRVAMRTGTGTGNVGLQWLAGDHLGSTAITANKSGGKDAELRYKAWGENRYTSGTTPTTYRFTGQRSEEAGIGLYWFNSRWYDSSLSRWAQPDTVVPVESQGTQAWDRYAFVNNNPTRYTDPSGHDVGCAGRNATDCALSHKICSQPNTFITKRQYSTNNAVATNDALLDLQTPGYSEKAGNSYTDYSTSGSDSNTAWVYIPSLFSDVAEWVLNSTEIRRYSPFNNSTVSGELYIQATDSGIVFTGASINNQTPFNLQIQAITAKSHTNSDGLDRVNWNQLYVAYSSSSYSGVAFPGTLSSPVPLSNYPINPGQTVDFNIYIVNEDGWFSNVGTSVVYP